MEQPIIKLNDGNEIPQFGLGVYTIPAGEPTWKACTAALGCGYRHIDTAHAYQNEASVGQAIRDSGIARDEVFVTSKLWPTEYGEGKTDKAIDRMLGRLGTDRIDLLLLHQQVGDYMGAWRDMEKAVKDGRVGSIGISNFDGERLDEVLDKARIPPAVLQVECHPYYQQHELKERLAPYGTVVVSWYPLGHGDKGLIDNPVVSRIASDHGRTNVQTILRWHIQEGNIVIPGSRNPDHIRSNLEACAFTLSDADMEAMRGMDRGVRYFNMPIEGQRNFLSWNPDD